MSMPIQVADYSDAQKYHKKTAGEVTIELACNGDLMPASERLRKFVTLERLAKLAENSELEGEVIL